MSTVNSNPQDRAAAADAAQRRFFPDAFKQEALKSGDQDLISEVLDLSSSTVSDFDAIGFARAVRNMSAKV